MFLETSVHLIHVPLVPVPLIQGTELLVHLRHAQDCLDMINLQETHRLTGLPVSDINPFLFREYLEKSVQWSEASIIHGRTGPIHNDT